MKLDVDDLIEQEQEQERDLYEGVFYCAGCGAPRHAVRILLFKEGCECGGHGFISTIDYNIRKILDDYREYSESANYECYE